MCTYLIRLQVTYGYSAHVDKRAHLDLRTSLIAVVYARGLLSSVSQFFTFFTLPFVHLHVAGVDYSCHPLLRLLPTTQRQ
jgi:hypothetical protein